jgi:GntR family transcriptional regulator/MocR family aminotransferase
MRPEPRRVHELLLEVELRRGRMRAALREALRAAIQDGRLAAGARLPASRRQAAELGVSRGVVSDTYEQLAAEGYLASPSGGQDQQQLHAGGGPAPAARGPRP